MNLLWACPQPTLVEAPTGSGLGWHVLPLRLRDLAALEGWVRAQADHPLAGKRVRLRQLRHAAGGDYGQLGGDSPAVRAYGAFVAEHVDLLDDPHAWPPGLDSPLGAALLASPAGRVEFLAVLLGRTHPEWTREKLAPLAEAIDLEAWLALEAAGWDRHPSEELSRIMDPPEPGPSSWGEAIARVAEAYGMGQGLDPILDLTLPQWTLLVSKGAHVPGSLHGSDRWIERVGDRRAEALERIVGRYEREKGEGDGERGPVDPVLPGAAQEADGGQRPGGSGVPRGAVEAEAGPVVPPE